MQAPTEREFTRWLTDRIGRAVDAAMPFPTARMTDRGEAELVNPPPRVGAAATGIVDVAHDICDYVVQRFGPFRCERKDAPDADRR